MWDVASRNLLATLSEHTAGVETVGRMLDVWDEAAGIVPSHPDAWRDTLVDKARLPEPIQEKILCEGLRNSHLLAIAPTGTISLLANNVRETCCVMILGKKPLRFTQHASG